MAMKIAKSTARATTLLCVHQAHTSSALRTDANKPASWYWKRLISIPSVFGWRDRPNHKLALLRGLGNT